ncbi:Ig-like domain-containing protein [Myxococcota bacterium]|nr:Ig-like domain-containing protein [Myxococcota bacterium]
MRASAGALLAFAIALAPPLALAPGCTPGAGSDDDSYEGIDETGPADDDSASPDDDSTPPDDDTAPPPEDEVVALALLPSDIAVDPGTTYALRLAGTTASGRTVALDGAFASSDGGVATVSPEGEVAGVADGEAWLTATYEDLSAEARVRVVAPGRIEVDVVDATTGAPLPGATALIGSTGHPVATATADEAGRAVLEGDFTGRQTVTAYADGYFRASLAGPAAREVRIPLRSRATEEAEAPLVEGDLEWPADLGGPGEIAVGVVAAGYAGNAVLYDFGGMMGPTRTATVYGFEVDLPGNFVIRDQVDRYAVPALPGDGAVWAIAGEVALDEAVEIASADPAAQVGLVLSTLAELLPEMRWGIELGFPVDATDGAEVPIVPQAFFADAVAATLPDPPLGTDPGDLPVLLALADVGGPGQVLCGIAAGPGETTLHRVADADLPPGAEVVLVAVVEQGGLGTGGDASAVRGHVDPATSRVVFPEFLELPTLIPPEYVADWTWAHSPVPGADLLYHRLRGTQADWDVYAPGDGSGFVLADVEPRLGFDQVFWYLHARALPGASFDSLAARADAGLDGHEGAVEGQSRTWLHYAATPDD